MGLPSKMGLPSLPPKLKSDQSDCFWQANIWRDWREEKKKNEGKQSLDTMEVILKTRKE